MADPAASGLIRVADYVWVTKDEASWTPDVERALDDALSLVEDHLNRHFAFGTHTERLYVYRDGKVYPTNTPLATVTTPAVSASAIQGAGVYVGSFLPTPEIVNVGDWTAAVPPQVDVTYAGGYQPYGTTNGETPQLPMKVMRAICRVAWLMLHPVVLPGIPIGAKSASVGDVSVTGDLESFVAIDPSIGRDLKPYRKRKAHAWQRG